MTTCHLNMKVQLIPKTSDILNIPQTMDSVQLECYVINQPLSRPLRNHLDVPRS
jgi:hypothetical protein